MNIILKELENIVKIAQDLTYRTIFNNLGITKILKDKFIDIKELPKKYADKFTTSIKEFMDLPVNKDMSLNDPDTMRYMRTNKSFKELIDSVLSEIQNDLKEDSNKVLNILKEYPQDKDIPFDEVVSKSKSNKIDLLFILSNLKDNEQIYNFDEKEIKVIE